MSCWRGWPGSGRHLSTRSGRRTSRSCCCGCWASSPRPAAPRASYQQAEEPVSQLINDFGPPVASPAAARQRPPGPSPTWNATYGTCATPLARRSARTLPSARLAAGPRSRRPPASTRRTPPGRPDDPGGRRPPAPGPALHPVLAELICAAVDLDLDLDVPALDLTGSGGAAPAARLRPRRRGFAEECPARLRPRTTSGHVRLRRRTRPLSRRHRSRPLAQPARPRRDSQRPLRLHHALFDLGVLGITDEWRICVSGL